MINPDPGGKPPGLKREGHIETVTPDIGAFNPLTGPSAQKPHPALRHTQTPEKLQSKLQSIVHDCRAQKEVITLCYPGLRLSNYPHQQLPSPVMLTQKLSFPFLKGFMVPSKADYHREDSSVAHQPQQIAMQEPLTIPLSLRGSNCLSASASCKIQV